MSSELVTLLYLVAGVLFILALRGLSSPGDLAAGQLLGMVGMAIAVGHHAGRGRPPRMPLDLGADRRRHRRSAAASARSSRRASR